MKTLRYCAPFFIVSVVIIFAVAAAKPSKDGVFDRLRAAASGVPGWIEQKDGYRAFTAQGLYGIIDGGATEYEQQGLKNGILVSFKNGDKVLEIYLDDFGKASRARGMVDIKKKSMSEAKVLSKATTSPAVYDEVIGGCIACWAKGAYYIEMTLTGYDAPKKAAEDAVTLINAMSPAIASGQVQNPANFRQVRVITIFLPRSL